MIWAASNIAEDEKELIDVVQSFVEQIIAVINPAVYKKIQEKKNATATESTEFAAELESRNISTEMYNRAGQETPENLDDGIDIISDPIQV